MNVDPTFTVHIAFKDAPVAEGIDVRTMLNSICARVEAIVQGFRPLFG
jgi:hypothetical protein